MREIEKINHDAPHTRPRTIESILFFVLSARDFLLSACRCVFLIFLVITDHSMSSASDGTARTTKPQAEGERRPDVTPVFDVSDSSADETSVPTAPVAAVELDAKLVTYLKNVRDF